MSKQFDWDEHDDGGGDYAPWWAPTVGDVLDGKVMRVHEAESQFGGVDPVITIASNAGELAWRVRSGGALRAVKAAGGVQVGDSVRVKRLPDGESTGKGNPPSRYAVEKTTAAGDPQDGDW